MSFTLNDIVAGLPAKSGGRNNWGIATDGSIGINAARQSVQEITETAELEELKYQTPIPPAVALQMTKGNPVISIASLLATIAANTVYPLFQSIATQITDITDVWTFWIWFAGGVNQSGRTLKYRRVTTVDMYTYGVTSNNTQSFGVAPPVYYSRYGTNLVVGPAPDNNYLFYVRPQLRHPFPATGQATAPIFAPDSWLEVFQRAAIVKLAMDEGIQDSSIYKTNIDFLEKRGMAPWQLRTLQQQRDERHNERALSLRQEVYSHR